VMDGLSATKAIREGAAGQSNQDIPIIIHSAYSSKQQMDDSLLIGANAYVSKPIDFNELFKIIEQLQKLESSSVDNTTDEQPVSDRQVKFRKLFLVELPVIQDGLQSALASQDRVQLKKIAHRHKSSTGMLGFDKLYALLTELESIAEVVEFDEVIRCYEGIMSELTSIAKQ